MQFAFELAAELGLTSVRAATTRSTRPSPVLAGLGFVLLGSGAGAVLTWLVPNHLVQPLPMPGLSLVLGPLAAGALMSQYGRWQRERGRVASSMATFWGGAAFAFAFALTRFVLLTFVFEGRVA